MRTVRLRAAGDTAPSWRDELREHTRRVLLPPFVLVAIMWVAEVIDAVLPLRLDALGIRPRQLDGLTGVLTAPFLHAGFAHLLANTGGFLILGVLVGVVTGRFWTVFAGTAVLGGLGTWLIGPAHGVVVGASGVVYGFAAFLVAWGILTRRVGAVLTALAVVALYGGLVLGLLPGNPFLSWQGHLCGAAAGVAVAVVLTRRTERDAGRPSLTGR